MEDKTAIKKAKRISVLLMSNLICLLIMQMLAGCNKSDAIIMDGRCRRYYEIVLII